mgnify:CR=1 FL=1
MRGALILLGLVVFVCAWLLPGHFPPWPAFQQQWAAALGVALLGLGAAWESEHATGIGHYPLWRSCVLRWRRSCSAPSGQILFRLRCSCCRRCTWWHSRSAWRSPPTLRGQMPEPWADWLMTALVGRGVGVGGLRCRAMAAVGTALPAAGSAAVRRESSFANLAQPNHLATLLALGVAATLHLFEAATGWRRDRRALCALVGPGPRDDAVAHRMVVRWHRWPL